METFDIDRLSFVLRAASFAAKAHRGQIRKDGSTPYAAHPTRVAFILAVGLGVDDPEILAAAFLHDTIEDTTTDRDDIEEAFGPRVAELVAVLTKDKRLANSVREDDYFDALESASPEARLIKLGDALDNLIDSGGIDAAKRLRTVRRARDVLERLGSELDDRGRALWAILGEAVKTAESDGAGADRSEESRRKGQA
jgi:(p)ppGpp synthase/HD superfamily hydrolase